MKAAALLLILTTAITVHPGQALANGYEQTMSRAASLEKARRYDEAATLLAALVRRYPQDYRVVLRAAWLHFRARRYARAQELYEQARRLNPEAEEPRLGLARTMLRQKQHEVDRLRKLAAQKKRTDAQPLLAMTMKRAAALEKARRVGEAATLLATLVRRYPQDYDVVLRAAWLQFRAHRYALAEKLYTQARKLNPTAREPRLGLAWTLYRRGQRAAAHRAFRIASKRWPGDASARQGLKLTRPAPLVQVQPTMGLAVLSYQYDETLSHALGGFVRLPLTISKHGLAGVSYRYYRFWRLRNAQQTPGRMDQHELYLRGGVAYRSFGVLAHYAFLRDGRWRLDAIHVLGATARYSPWGDILFEANGGFYNDMKVWKLGLAWRLPVNRWLDVTPGATLQLAVAKGEFHDQLEGRKGQVLGAGHLTLRAHGRWGHVHLGAQVGEVVRPATLGLDTVLIASQRIPYRVWGGLLVRLGNGFNLTATYGLDRLSLDRLDGTRERALQHTVTMGLGWVPE